jgi:hypothetical protein
VASPACTARDWEYVTTRLATYRGLFNLPSFDLSGFLEPLLQSLPFRLGESAAETSIPIAFDDLLIDAVDRAVDDLAELLRRRRDNELEPKPPPLGSFVEGDTRKLTPVGYSGQPFASRPLHQAAAMRAMRSDPLLDSSVLEAWIVRGQGGPLLEHLAGLFSHLCEEDLRNTGATPFLHLGWTATIDVLESKKGRAKHLVSRLYPWEKIEKAVGFALYSLAEAAAEQTIAPVTARRLNFDTAAYSLRLRAAMSPMALCSIRGKTLQNDISPWGLSQALADAIVPVWLSLLEEDPSPRNAEQRLLGAIVDDPELRQRAARAAGVLLARRHALQWLSLFDGLDAELSAALVGALPSDEALFKLLCDPKALLTRLQRFAKSRKADSAGELASADLFDVLRRGPEREDAIREVASAFTCLVLDRVAVGAVDSARRCLRDRRAEFTREQLIADYMAGRLYRLSADSYETRRSLTRKSQGHLFIDLKGFTQRTYRAKEIVMAEFLRTEFYEPILVAAARLAVDETGGRQLVLQNLLGDAAVFSGEMPALIELAQAIQRICRAYGEKLRARTGASGRDAAARKAEIESSLRSDLERLRLEACAVEEEINRKLSLSQLEREQLLWAQITHRINEMEARYRRALAARDDLEARLALEAVQSLRHHEKEVFGKVENLFGQARDDYIGEMLVAQDRLRLKELQRSAAERRRAAEAQMKAAEEDVRARSGFGLEAGLFITYGAAAEVAAINDLLFGLVKVAIAEGINEAARGTARNGILKARLDALVDKARAERQDPQLEYPFRVYVDSAYNLLLPTGLNDMVDRAIRGKDAELARRAARSIAETVLRDLARAMNVGDGQPPEALSVLSEIYNTGEALSGEALAAYLTATAAERFWFRKVLTIDELDAEFHELFCFLSNELELVISVPHDGDSDNAIVFHRAGQVQFRGFEAKRPTTVYEMLRPDSPFSLLLVQKHLALWSAEARGQNRREELPS